MNRRGSVLIVALWTLILLGVFAVSLAASARQQAALGRRLERLDALRLAALSGAAAAKSVLRETDLSESYDALTERWADDDEAFKDYPVGAASFTIRAAAEPRVRYGLSDEQSRLNLNTADARAIAALLRQVTSLEEEPLERLAHAIVDWRDSDSQYGHPDYGAEDTDYDDLDPPVACKDAPYESLDELLLVMGMTRPIHDTIKPYVTAYGTGQVNLNTASRPVLVAVGMSPSLADKVLAYRQGPDGIEATPDDRAFTGAGSAAADLDRMSPPLDAAERTALEALVSEGRCGTAGEQFRIECRATDRLGAEVDLEAVMDRKGNVYHWSLSDVRWNSRS